MTAATLTVVEKFQAVEQEMNEVVIDQPKLVHELLLAIGSRGHLLALGEAGIAKTYTVDVFQSHAIDVKKFYAMCFKAMDHQVLIGNLSPKRLIEEDVLAYNIEGKLPDAEIAVLDEIFKNNAVNLNMMLPILNERRFVTNGHIHTCPLWTCVGTSNIDEYHITGELAAFRDRFGAALLIEPVSTDDGFKRILQGQVDRFAAGVSIPTAVTMLTRDDILELQDTAQAVGVPQIVIEALNEVRKKAEQEGLRISPRRFGEAIKRMKAQAALRGDVEVKLTDIPLLQDSLWTDLQDRGTAFEVVVEYAGQSVSIANKLRKTLEPVVVTLNDLGAEIASDPDAELSGTAAQSLARMLTETKSITKKLDEALDDAKNAGDDTTDLAAVKRELEAAVRTIHGHLGV